ncbi:TPM domain-containing protein [Novosphingobium sp. BL-8H]|uniref:TPM domain-containing protein n=1 Tax=Novosphingobium sp. BL-8H TaxID=3127640 RepID=UPI0037583EE7
MNALRAVAAAILLAFGALLAQQAAAEPTFPKLTGRVVDDANIIPDDQEAQLTQKLDALEKNSGRQLVVVTLPSLQGYEISDYGYQLGRAWGIGEKDKNTGALLIVAPNERKVRIEVGYGLEPIITDGLSFLIINNQILPRFKANDYPGGINAGADALIKQLTLPPDQARKVAADADAARKPQEGGFPIGTIIFIGFIVLFVVLPMINEARGGGRRRSGLGGPIIWMPGPFGRDDDDDHWGGGGGFGGGDGFSGGGGSFGGGGASGSW